MSARFTMKRIGKAKLAHVVKQENWPTKDHTFFKAYCNAVGIPATARETDLVCKACLTAVNDEINGWRDGA